MYGAWSLMPAELQAEVLCTAARWDLAQYDWGCLRPSRGRMGPAFSDLDATMLEDAASDSNAPAQALSQEALH